MDMITAVTVTPLRLALKTPYIWSQGVEDAFTVNLIEITCGDGTKGYGETPATPDADAQALVLRKIGARLIGTSVFDITGSLASAYKGVFLAFGGNMPRYFAQLAHGIEMAAMDAQGKLMGRPVWDLLGGAVRPDVGYFYFLQGKTPAALAADAAHAVGAGHPILYLKVGVSDEHDMDALRAVRKAAPGARLRLDANEAWDQAKALRMITAMAPYNVEYIEQPTPSGSQAALAHVAAKSPIPIGADQSVFTLGDVYNAVSSFRTDMVAVGPREIGGMRAMIKAAAVCEAAGVPLCIHSSMTSGLTTCAEHHIARCIPNLDDGNQIMFQLLRDDIVSAPDLRPHRGRMALPPAPGLGCRLNHDVVAEAAEAHRRFANA